MNALHQRRASGPTGRPNLERSPWRLGSNESRAAKCRASAVTSQNANCRVSRASGEPVRQSGRAPKTPLGTSQNEKSPRAAPTALRPSVRQRFARLHPWLKWG